MLGNMFNNKLTVVKVILPENDIRLTVNVILL